MGLKGTLALDENAAGQLQPWETERRLGSIF